MDGSIWHYCFECNRAFDPVETVAYHYHEEPLEVAVNRLTTSIHSEDKLQMYLDTCRLRTECIRYFEECRKNIAASYNIRHLLTRFRLTNQLTYDQWFSGPGRHIGASTYKTIEKVLRPRWSRTHSKVRCPGRFRYFTGRGWGDILILPFYDLPGRICGFEVVGRDGDYKDRLFRPAIRLPGPRPEGGLFGLTDALKRAQKWVIAVEDPFLALRLIIRYYEATGRALPCVAWVDKKNRKTLTTWKFIPDHTRVIFWAVPMCNKRLLHIAKAANNAEISCPVNWKGLPLAEFDRQLAETRIEDTISDIVRSSEPAKRYQRELAESS